MICGFDMQLYINSDSPQSPILLRTLYHNLCSCCSLRGQPEQNFQFSLLVCLLCEQQHSLSPLLYNFHYYVLIHLTGAPLLPQIVLTPILNCAVGSCASIYLPSIFYTSIGLLFSSKIRAEILKNCTSIPSTSISFSSFLLLDRLINLVREQWPEGSRRKFYN